MPVAPTYPGVYIEEIPSGVRTITGVATSITAFVGRALRGPVNDPIMINNYGDFERTFGGLWLKSAMSYSVRDFFGNGGAQAIIVRLYRTEEAPPAATPDETAAYIAATAVFDAAAQAVTKTQKIGVIDAVATTSADYTEGPAQTAAASVVQAVTAADITGSTADDLKTAASDAAEALNPTTAEETAEYNAAKAVSDAAQGETTKPGVITAVTAAAAGLTNPTEAEQTAAASVAQAVNDANVAGSTAATLQAAASTAAELLKPPAATPDETANYNAALAVSVAAQEITPESGVIDAVTAAAAVYTEDPEQTAAASVVEAVTAADITGSIADDLKAAASKAAQALNPGPALTKAKIVVGSGPGALNLEAASEGRWGNGLEVTVTVPVLVEDSGPPPFYSPTDVTAAKDLGLLPSDIFNLYVTDTIAGKTESFLNVTVAESARRIDRVLEDQSALIRVFPVVELSPALPETRPTATARVTASVASDASDGTKLTYEDFTTGTKANKEGLYALDNADLFNLLCIPPHEVTGEIEGSLIAAAATYAEKRRAFFIVDPPTTWFNKEDAKTAMQNAALGSSKNAAVFFPRLRKPDPLRENQLRDFVPCGAVAGVIARTDSTRGLWKAPAGFDASLKGVPALSIPLTDAENGELNPLGLNCLRAMGPAGRVIWGSRTLQGHDQLASEWKYLPVRRVALYIEESLYRGTHWAVFEPNDEPLWAQIRLNLGAFMHNLFRQGAFQGSSPKDAYFVKCSKETTTQNDINLGIVNILVGFAPLKPAEFVIIKIQQMAGQVEA